MTKNSGFKFINLELLFSGYPARYIRNPAINKKEGIIYYYFNRRSLNVKKGRWGTLQHFNHLVAWPVAEEDPVLSASEYPGERAAAAAAVVAAAAVGTLSALAPCPIPAYGGSRRVTHTHIPVWKLCLTCILNLNI